MKIFLVLLTLSCHAHGHLRGQDNYTGGREAAVSTSRKKSRSLATSSTAYLACGKPSSPNCLKYDGFNEVLADKNEAHEVRCCSETSKSGWKKNSGCSVWGESDLIGAEPGATSTTCHHASTYFEAEAICQANDARLCTKEEVLGGCTQGSGCNHDLDMVWTKTEPIGHLVEMQYISCGRNGGCGATGAKLVHTKDPMTLAYTRCCSHEAINGWTFKNDCAVYTESDHSTIQSGHDNGKCSGLVTFAEAESICAGAGPSARLCTKEEAVKNCARGTGCNYDVEMIWTKSVGYVEVETTSPPTPSPTPSPTVANPLILATPNLAVTAAGSPIEFSGCNSLSISAGELGDGHTLTLSVTDGSLALADTAGLTMMTSEPASTLTFSGTVNAMNAAMDGMTFTSSNPGRHDFIMKTSDGASLATFKVVVNSVFDADSAKNDLTNNVSQMHSAVQPGRMVAFESTAHSVIMYPGNAAKEGPMVAVATLGNGRIVAVPDHQMLNMQPYGDVSGQFYKNALEWLKRPNVDVLEARVITYNQDIYDWLSAEGYTNVAKIDSGELLSSLTSADIFVGWMGSSVSDEDIEALKEFCSNGGGLFIAEYGVGYDWWWGKDMCYAPGNLLLREAGLGFRSGHRWDTGVMDASNHPTAGGLQVTSSVVLDMLTDSSSYSAEELEEGGYVMGGLYDALAEDDYILCKLDKVFDQRIASINPSPTNKITDAFEKALLNREADILTATAPHDVTAHRTVEDVYGAIPEGAPRVTKTVKIDTSRNRWHPTGLYAAPGEVVTVQVPPELVGKGYNVRINAHTDNIGKRDAWERFPYVHRSFKIETSPMEVANAFGGAIFVSLGGGNRDVPPNIGIVSVTISNAVEHPYFVLGQHTDEEWVSSLRDKPAPYAVFVCPSLIIVQRSEESSTLTEPTKLMNWWQSVVDLQDDLAGYKEIGIPDRSAAELINVDVQNSAGAAHSGFPIQAYDRHWGNLANVDYLTVHGTWGDFHELGHNHQKGWWTFASDGEVTVNIFSAYCSQTLHGDDAATWTWVVDPEEVMRKAVSAVESSSKYEGTNNHLPFWIQLADGFGWQTMKAVFIEYENDSIVNPASLPTNVQEVKDQWLVRFSKQTMHDLTEFMTGAWGLEVSDAAVAEVKALEYPTWMPAMGGLSSISVRYNGNVTFDLDEEALSLDGVAMITDIAQGSKGSVVENTDEGTVTYIPNAGASGIDNFSYKVISSSGHEQVTDVEVHIETVAEGSVEVWFHGRPQYNGAYFESTELIGGVPFWETSNYMIFYCGDIWALTSTYYRQGLIDSDGSGCGGYWWSNWRASGSTATEWYEYDWDGGATFEFPQ